MNGILCMNKPKGFTSFDVIAKLRGIIRIKRLGHAGTLDPMAEGVLPVFVGKATKACDILPYNEKSYTAGFRLGIETDTQDTTGNIVKSHDKKVSLDDIKSVLPHFTGTIMQTPPMYSAVSVNGQRLYKLARKGITIDVPKREASVSKLEITEFDEDSQTGILNIKCGKGTYVRTIIHDIGQELSCGAAMTSLVRTSSNGFTLDDCTDFENVQKMYEENRLEELIIPVDSIFSELPRINLDEKQTFLYKNGVRLSCEGYEQKRYTVYGNDGLFIGTAVTDMENGILKSEKNFF
ncbi:MAG TPA: tRNA pseudouridine(55) synthase TruB [Ruminococcus sp.]|nr:tRNA pseudouridine(55) synthase TruB [Ruminococcus sp.]